MNTLILQCWLSGQMTAKQFQEHLKDPAFAEWYEKQK